MIPALAAQRIQELEQQIEKADKQLAIATTSATNWKRQVDKLEAEREESRACFYRASQRIKELEDEMKFLQDDVKHRTRNMHELAKQVKDLQLELDHSQRSVITLSRELQNTRNLIPPDSL